MSNQRFCHYVKPNEITRVPRRHIFLDVESHRIPDDQGEAQTWRLAVAQFWSNDKGRKEHDATATFDAPNLLWAAVDTFCRQKSRTVLWAHNLGYDVRVSEAFDQLPRLGWSLVAHNLSGKGCWLQWRKDRASLCMVDSASVFPLSLAQVGEHFALGKPPLPRDDDTRDAWIARCAADVLILSTAVRAYLQWIEEADLGNWQMTGSGQCWAIFRHKFMSHRLLVHDDDQALRAERRAMWTGRCEAYWHGAIKFQVVHEWDLTLAYARIARDTPLPTRLIGPMPVVATWRRHLANPRVAVLAEVEVVTETPVVPAEKEGRIVWPVGAFTTTLWGPEITAAIDAGATVTPIRGWLYRADPCLRDWATWIITRLEAPDNEVPAWQKVIHKADARRLIGRFAMTYTQWDAVATAPDVNTRRAEYFDLRTGTQGEILQIGRDVFERGGTQEWEHSMPAITGYVMSVCRVRLWDIMRACPPNSILYVDTDSILATDRHHDHIRAVAESSIGHGLRLKRSWDGFAIWGPRQVVTGQQVRVSGLPKRARQIGRHQFRGEVWESLETATRRGHFTRVHVAQRQWTMKGVDHRRVGGSVGWTRPHSMGQG